MEFTLSCEVFARLSNVCRWMREDEDRAYLRALYVERANGKLIAVATNSKIAAIELLSNKADGPDEHCFIMFDPALVAQCQQEAGWQSTLHIVTNDMLQWTTAKTMFGYVHPTNVGIYPNKVTETDGWRKWFPAELADRNYGQIQITAELLADLGRASPSGKLFFPPFTDARCPTMVRDHHAPNWYGLFMITFENQEKSPNFTLPKW